MDNETNPKMSKQFPTPRESFSGAVPSDATIERTIHAKSLTEGDSSDFQGVEDHYNEGFLLAKFSRTRTDLGYATMAACIGFASMTLLLLTAISIYVAINDPGVFLAYADGKRLQLGMLAVGTVTLTIYAQRMIPNVLRLRRLIAYNRWSPEAGVIIVDQAYTPSLLDRLQSLRK